MKKFTSLLIGVSLALAGAAYAQQTEESPAAGGKKGKEKTTEQTETKAPKTHVEKTTKPEATVKPTGATKETGAGNEQGPVKGHKAKAEKSATETETGASGQTGGAATTEAGTGKGKGKRGANAEASASAAETGATTETGTGKGKGKGRAKAETSAATGTSASTEASATAAPGGKRGGRAAGANTRASAAPSMTPATAASASAAPSVAAAASAAPSVAATGATGQQNTGANANAPATTGAATTHVEKQKVEQVKQQTATIKQQHANFRATARPDRAPAVTFNENFRIQGSDRWSGPQYEVYRSYRPERHDRNWYHSRYQRLELIAGGYYYFNNGYWYPAWGYDPGQEYYAYDAPIYVGHRAEPPDRVIADVQAALQEMGYYQGEVDGLTGPLTREALAAYQADQGLQVTAVMDEPTLDSLNLSS